MQTAAELIREARGRAGVTQRSLALRAGTKQSTISRLESGAERPTVDRLRQILLVLGFELDLALRRLEPAVDPAELAAARAMDPAERLREAAAWNRFAAAVADAGARSRDAE